MRRRRERGQDGWINEAAVVCIRMVVGACLVIAAMRVASSHLDRRHRPAPGRELGSRVQRLPGPRGVILDRNHTPLAHSVLHFDIELECYGDEDLPAELAAGLVAAVAKDRELGPAERERLMGLCRLPPPDSRLDLWRDRDKPCPHPRYYWKRSLAKGVHAAAALRDLEELGAKRFRGVRFRIVLHERWRRVYPLGESAAHVVGIVGEDERGRTVASGLEAMPVLEPQDSLAYELRRDAQGNAYAAGTDPCSPPTAAGKARLVTTLDAGLQELAHRRIAEAVDGAQATWGMLCVIGLEDGDVLALAGHPGFDPDSIDEDAAFWPPTHHALFEPGSVIKPLVIGLAVDLGIVRPGQLIRCCGEDGSKVWRLRGSRGGVRTITDDHLVGRDTPLEQLLIQSSNIGAVRVGAMGGVDFHRELLRRFRLDEPPLLGLPLQRDKHGDPMRGVVPSERDLSNPRNYERYSGPSLSFGYELNVYPLTFAAAFAQVVTGRAFQLRLVRELITADGTPCTLPVAGPGERVLKESTVRWMRETLKGVVRDAEGTAHRHVSGPETDGILAGKTGTSFTSQGRRKSTASFVGFVPADAPRYLALAVLQKDEAVKFYGGKFAAPAVKDVLLYMLQRDRRRALSAEDARFLGVSGGARAPDVRAEGKPSSSAPGGGH